MATSALKSYAFISVQDVGAAKPTRTVLSGSANRPYAVSYTLTARGKHTQIIRITAATYVRVLPAAWSKVTKRSAPVDPVAGLLTLLAAIRAPAAAGTTVTGTIPAGSARDVGLPDGSTDAAVTITLDRTQHVVALDLATSVRRSSGTPVKVTIHTTFSSLNHAARIVAPI